MGFMKLDFLTLALKMVQEETGDMGDTEGFQMDRRDETGQGGILIAQ